MATTSPAGPQAPEPLRSRALNNIAPRLAAKPVLRTEPSAPEFEPLLDSDEAAGLLKIHPKTLQKMARCGEIAGVKIGKLWRFRASALNEWLKVRMVG